MRNVARHQADWHTDLPPFQDAGRDHVRAESCCFPRELASFDPWQVTRSPPIGKLISVGRYDNTTCVDQVMWYLQ